MTGTALAEAVRDFDVAALIAGQQPVVLRGLVRDWPLVRAGLTGADAAADYLKRFYQGAPVVGYAGPPQIHGRFFYDDSVTAMNFTATRVKLDAWLDRLLGTPQDEALYIGSTDLDTYLPGLRDANDLPATAFAGATPRASIWIGNHTVAATHYDMSNNVACCVAGRRRFTLFPPEQVANLYPGPLDPTPGGQAVSMVDPRAPDLARYPRFAEAQRAAQVFDLEPGDVLVYPALWWHNVEALDGFNILINYWWNDAPAFLDSPMNTLLHGLLSLRDRPDSEKQAWRALFDYYVFGPAERAGEHLPEAARGPLAPLDAPGARRLRAYLLQRLNR
ncbi:cupin-like domain-containing protein [Sphingomonas panacis]|uniref:cupin-like domain-containing protein n=1 Tax=Sphingomonas panacis TaxID=1560345 RepID=UPI000AA35D84|nr:cupin-like domain-containing protein [Sphingomonas panacis]